MPAWVVGAVIHNLGTQILWLNVLADLNSFLLFIALGRLGGLLISERPRASASVLEREPGHLTVPQPSTD